MAYSSLPQTRLLIVITDCQHILLQYTSTFILINPKLSHFLVLEYQENNDQSMAGQSVGFLPAQFRNDLLSFGAKINYLTKMNNRNAELREWMVSFRDNINNFGDGERQHVVAIIVLMQQLEPSRGRGTTTLPRNSNTRWRVTRRIYDSNVRTNPPVIAL